MNYEFVDKKAEWFWEFTVEVLYVERRDTLTMEEDHNLKMSVI